MLALLALTHLMLATNPQLDEARVLVDAVHYPEAEKLLRVATQVPTSTKAELREAYELLARAKLAQGRPAEAEAVYGELLARDPDAGGPVGGSPKVLEAFERAKLKLYPRGFVSLTAQHPIPGMLQVLLTDPWHAVERVVLVASDHSEPLPETDRTYRARLQPGMRFHLEARAADGHVLAVLGTAQQPLEVPQVSLAADVGATPARVARGPARWPAWLLAAVSVGALGTAVALGVSSTWHSQAAGRSLESREVRTLDAMAFNEAVSAYALAGLGVLGGGGTAILVWRW